MLSGALLGFSRFGDCEVCVQLGFCPEHVVVL